MSQEQSTKERALLPNYLGVFEEKLKRTKKKIKKLAKEEKSERVAEVLRKELAEYKSLLKIVRKAREQRSVAKDDLHSIPEDIILLLKEVIEKRGPQRVREVLKGIR